jgi:hypothetical protein
MLSTPAIRERERSALFAASGQLELLEATDFQAPRIDKPAVEAAITDYLLSERAPARQFRWFDDGRSARDYIAPEKAFPAYSSKGYFVNRQALDAAWSAGNSPSPTQLDQRKAPSLSLRDKIRQMYDEAEREAVPKYLSELLSRLERPDQEQFKVDRSVAEPTLPAASILRGVVAGLYYVKFGVNEVVCIPRPSLWIAAGRLHREDGPAVEWLGGERYFFWRGVHVAPWVIEQPEVITLPLIGRERNKEHRRCMIERFGIERFIREADAKFIGKDCCGKLWRVESAGQGRYAFVEVENGTREPDGTRRRYFFGVPPSMQSPREAMAWSYGLRPEQYDLAVRT